MVGGGGGLVHVELAAGEGVGGSGQVLGLDGPVEGGGVYAGQGDLESVDVGQGVALAGDGVDARNRSGPIDDLGADRGLAGAGEDVVGAEGGVRFGVDRGGQRGG